MLYYYNVSFAGFILFQIGGKKREINFCMTFANLGSNYLVWNELDEKSGL